MDFVNEDSQGKNRESKLRSSATNYLNKSLGEDRAKAVLEFMDLCIDAADVHSSEAIAYAAFLCMLLASAYFVTEPHVGIMYMLGAAFQVLGLILLDVKVLRDRKASGVSCYALTALAISTGLTQILKTSTFIINVRSKSSLFRSKQSKNPKVVNNLLN